MVRNPDGLLQQAEDSWQEHCPPSTTGYHTVVPSYPRPRPIYCMTD